MTLLKCPDEALFVYVTLAHRIVGKYCVLGMSNAHKMAAKSFVIWRTNSPLNYVLILSMLFNSRHPHKVRVYYFRIFPLYQLICKFIVATAGAIQRLMI